MPEMEIRIEQVTRRANSPSGNPRFAISTVHGSFLTKQDAAVNYKFSHSWEGRNVRLELDDNQQVVGVEEIDA